MTILDLAQEYWTFQAPDRRWLAARVPGCIHADLRAQGLIPDPFHGRNELELQWIERRAWRYRCDFALPPDLGAQERVELCFDGLDTVAEARLNGVTILRSENMFHLHRVDVRETLRRGRNRLEVSFASALDYIRTTRADYSTRESNDPVGGRYRIRKQQSQFGWDWGPRFVTAGLWRGVRLEAWDGARLATVQVRQRHARGEVTLELEPELEPSEEAAVFRATLALRGRVVATAEGARPRLRVERPELWWPAGQGEQTLHELRVERVPADGGPALPAQVWSRRIGLRRIELDLATDGLEVPREHGSPLTRFGFRVNGRLIFAKGANWIPAHAFVAGLGRADHEPLLRAARDAHMNTIRVWGGGVYEEDAFYDLCDELGLLVWQDHLFACSLYPADEAFLASVRREVADHVARLRHHASLALWCGDNEAVMWNGRALAEEPSRRADYHRLFFEAIPAVLRALDPDTAYLHSSPAYALPGHPDTALPSHDAHDWEVWHSRKAVGHYETTRHRFVSEFGMQSFPSLPVARTFCPPGELNLFSPVFQNHQKNTGGNATILDYTTRLFRLPDGYGAIAYLSQLNQAHCMKVAVEHFRRSQPHCLGALYWQLNDCWPVASWSSLEFGGRPKALHHAARRFFAPALVSARQLGEETVTVGNYPRNTKGVVELWTSYDAPRPRRARLEWTLLTLRGEVLRRGAPGVLLRPLQSRLVAKLDLTREVEREGRENTVLRLRLLDVTSGELLSENTVLFAAPRFLELPGVGVKTLWRRGAEGAWELVLRSPVVQLGVWLEPVATEAAPDDNAFDLFPGETKVVRFGGAAAARGRKPPELRLRSVARPE